MYACLDMLKILLTNEFIFLKMIFTDLEIAQDFALESASSITLHWIELDHLFVKILLTISNSLAVSALLKNIFSI